MFIFILLSLYSFYILFFELFFYFYHAIFSANIKLFLIILILTQTQNNTTNILQKIEKVLFYNNNQISYNSLKIKYPK